uniref:Uncharacterized protein n=1 Tax=Utricularia reniformis TaxID=192314 RepID=A0A1Y0B243_9LAMI|nr:hypothetical protein AEK19_MT1315 [Utricularia reniformis]ART31516.1 hypothetical protein AEK19_MT1315 [Utricularia reniformis]
MMNSVLSRIPKEGDANSVGLTKAPTVRNLGKTKGLVASLLSVTHPHSLLLATNTKLSRGSLRRKYAIGSFLLRRIE